MATQQMAASGRGGTTDTPTVAGSSGGGVAMHAKHVRVLTATDVFNLPLSEYFLAIDTSPTLVYVTNHPVTAWSPSILHFNSAPLC